jgi:hypothetical protein
MLRIYLQDYQRHELIACGTPTTSIKTAPKEDIRVMKKKLRRIARTLQGSRGGGGSRIAWGLHIPALEIEDMGSGQMGHKKI